MNTSGPLKIKHVPVHFVEGVVFPPFGQIYTDDLNGGTAIAVVSPHGAILASVASHYIDLPSAGSDPRIPNFRTRLQRFVALYNDNRCYFPASATHSYILAAMHNGTVALPDQIQRAEEIVHQTLGIPPIHLHYSVLPSNAVRTPGQTVFAIVAEENGEMPAIFVNGKRMA
ncbi:hypothetical protein K461DRAFT_63351 [Myriangium duriaei CBS 260.36]|uniref:Uncharacterized protein n=1 Tax=Myriangium duriaei CBS 260.36 TaxID=1168546 RepID=A0A9P4MFY8_9PEZI|nr:hypothetical protein K461DRAFT_63351 [Myriangium duriaei CBS 260.36]